MGGVLTLLFLLDLCLPHLLLKVSFLPKFVGQNNTPLLLFFHGGKLVNLCGFFGPF
jgi:hypothetical protein